MATIIMKCACYHLYQDKRYGKGKHVHNVSDKNKEATCTVCSTKKSIK